MPAIYALETFFLSIRLTPSMRGLAQGLVCVGRQNHLHIRPNAGIKRRSIVRRSLLASLGEYWLTASFAVSASCLEVFEEAEASST